MTMTENNDTSVRLAVNWGEVKFLCALPKAIQKSTRLKIGGNQSNFIKCFLK
jgi:hypothetical protein